MFFIAKKDGVVWKPTRCLEGELVHKVLFYYMGIIWRYWSIADDIDLWEILLEFGKRLF
jgi:hypothetical protein